jgi:hypothetical protein
VNPLLFSIFLTMMFGCSAPSKDRSSSELASDTMAQDKIRAWARKTTEHREVCFEITLQMKDVELKDAAPSNWTLAWVDQNSRYYLMNLTQRNPASFPEKRGDLFVNQFKVCSPEEKFGRLQYLLLSPKSLSIPEVRGMKLEWE